MRIGSQEIIGDKGQLPNCGYRRIPFGCMVNDMGNTETNQSRSQEVYGHLRYENIVLLAGKGPPPRLCLVKVGKIINFISGYIYPRCSRRLFNNLLCPGQGENMVGMGHHGGNFSLFCLIFACEAVEG